MLVSLSLDLIARSGLSLLYKASLCLMQIRAPIPHQLGNRRFIKTAYRSRICVMMIYRLKIGLFLFQFFFLFILKYYKRLKFDIFCLFGG